MKGRQAICILFSIKYHSIIYSLVYILVGRAGFIFKVQIIRDELASVLLEDEEEKIDENNDAAIWQVLTDSVAADIGRARLFEQSLSDLLFVW